MKKTKKINSRICIFKGPWPIADGTATFKSELSTVKKLTYLHRNNISAKVIKPERKAKCFQVATCK